MKNEYIKIMAALHAVMIEIKEIQSQVVVLMADDSYISKEIIEEIVNEINKSRGV